MADVSRHSDRGIALANEGKLDDAVKEFREALRIRPDYAEARYNLGVVYSNHGRLEEAISEYQQALKINPDYAEAHYGLGVAYGTQRKLEEAIAEYQQALKINPDYAEAHCNLGVIYRTHGDLEGAVSAYQQALRINPDYAEAHCNLGVAYTSQGKLEDAAGEFEEALRVNPDLAYAHNNLGGVYYEQRRLVEAISEYRDALRIDPRYAHAHYNLGVAFEAIGKASEAIASYRAFMELASPQHAYLVNRAEESMNRLAQLVGGLGKDRDAPHAASRRSVPLDDRDSIESGLDRQAERAGAFRDGACLYSTKPTARSLRRGSISKGTTGEILTYDPETNMPCPVVCLVSESAGKAGLGAPALSVHIEEQDLQSAMDEPSQWQMVCPKCGRSVSIKALLDTGRYNAIDFTELFCPYDGDVQMLLQRIESTEEISRFLGHTDAADANGKYQEPKIHDMNEAASAAGDIANSSLALGMWKMPIQLEGWNKYVMLCFTAGYTVELKIVETGPVVQDAKGAVCELFGLTRPIERFSEGRRPSRREVLSELDPALNNPDCMPWRAVVPTGEDSRICLCVEVNGESLQVGLMYGSRQPAVAKLKKNGEEIGFIVSLVSDSCNGFISGTPPLTACMDGLKSLLALVRTENMGLVMCERLHGP